MSVFNRDHKDSPGYMPERYDYASWDFLTGCDLSKNHHETMSRTDQSVRFNDEEYYTGGLCPSCRLAVNKESGRLKWCMGGNDSWRARIKLMLLIPVLLLPITIIFIAISKSTVVGTISHPKPQVLESARLNIVAEESFLPTVRDDLEESETEDRELLQEVKTSFVPVDEFPSLPPPHSRRKRDASKKWNVYPGNVTRDLIIWGFPANESTYREFEFEENLLPNIFMKIWKRTNQTARGLRTSRISRDDPSELQILPREDQDAEQETGKPIANLEELQVNYSVEEAEAYDNGEIDQNDYSQDSEQSYSKSEESENPRLPWRLSDTLDKDKQEEGQSQSEVDDAEQSRPSIDDETWLAIDDEVTDITSDFHAFWKGEGNIKSIREAQAKVMLKYMDRTADPCQDFYQYACGNWAKRNPIPKDKAGYDTFEML
ncbi:uncharacterized protein LOC107268136, partial [Cephus cinctus]|uniref:Uncharacterized protein LOC107268136 n=1 Tax=Cephus cinctus TaxID=211228 RepID=A0AAJ7W1K9_CEPCN